MDDVRYVAFCDILGFSNRILSDFNATQKAYQEFASLMSNPVVEEVTTTMYSDAILMTGESLGKILSAVQSVWFFALAQNLMICGAITQGRYWEQRNGHHLFVVSDALVRAVKLERSVGVPAVVIADDGGLESRTNSAPSRRASWLTWSCSMRTHWRTSLRKVSGVVANGRYYDSTKLEHLLARANAKI
jgi:hypothetical protein